MWKDLVENKDEWIGGRLIDYGDIQDRRWMPDDFPLETQLTDIQFSAGYILFIGEDFECGGSCKFVSLRAEPDFPIDGDGLAFWGYRGHEWHIVKP